MLLCRADSKVELVLHMLKARKPASRSLSYSAFSAFASELCLCPGTGLLSSEGSGLRAVDSGCRFGGDLQLELMWPVAFVSSTQASYNSQGHHGSKGTACPRMF